MEGRKRLRKTESADHSNETKKLHAKRMERGIKAGSTLRKCFDERARKRLVWTARYS